MVTAKNVTGAPSDWSMLLDLLNAQGHRCPYTGDYLVLGVNASVDHIYPRLTHRDRINDPSNLEWVTREVNDMKKARTPEDFIAFLSVIVKNGKDRFPSR